MIASSVLNTDDVHLSRDIRATIESDTERFHVDIMNSHFIPNLSYRPELVKDSKRSFPFAKAETHLMSDNLDTALPPFVEAGYDILEFHHEATNRPGYWLNYLKNHNIRCGMVINPLTSVNKLKPFLNKLDQVLLMTVRPGFGGQEFEEVSADRLIEPQDMIKNGNLDLPIEVSGGIDRETLKLTHDTGAKIFIAGSYIFKNGSAEDQVMKLKKGDK